MIYIFSLSKAVCSVKHRSEIVLDFFSIYGNHFNPMRSTDDQTSNEDFEIAVNGPDLSHCEDVVEEAMNKYGKGEWHFTRPQLLKS